MRALLLTHGTRGDVQPFIGLACALQASGHEPVLAAPRAFKSLVESHSIQFTPLSDGPNVLLPDHTIRAAFERNYRGLLGKTLAIRIAHKHRAAMRPVLSDIVTAANSDFDIIIHHIILPGQAVAKNLDVRAASVCMQPFWAPTRSSPNPMISIQLPRGLNKLSYYTSKIWYQILVGNTRRTSPPLRPGRRTTPQKRRSTEEPAPLLQALSPQLLPPGTNDYPPYVHTTGFWWAPLPNNWTPPNSLVQFLQNGTTPIYVGFGSMVGTNPSRTGAVIRDALRIAGLRAVVAAGSGGIDCNTPSDDVYLTQDVPHSWLFPRVSLIVHHGGSGTTGAALAAGKPQVVCPFVGDQPYYSRRLHEIGVAPAPVPQRHLTTRTLSNAIQRAISDRTLRVNAERIGNIVRSEGATETAVRILEEFLDGTQ